MAKQRLYVLWGSAGHAKVLNDAICYRGSKVVALFDNSPAATSVLKGTPLIGGPDTFISWMGSQPNDLEIFGLIAIGGSRGSERIKMQNFMADYGVRIEPFIHPLSHVSTSARLGPGAQVLAMSSVAADANVGSACIINHKASVDHECEIADGVHVAPGATLCGCVTVEANAMIGAGAVVLPRLRIGASSIVGAGAVVTRDVPPNTTVMGNPAQITPRLIPYIKCHKK